VRADNNISSELRSRVEGLAKNNTNSAEILVTNKRNAELFVLHQAMVEHRWEDALALVRDAPELLRHEATLAHPELSHASVEFNAQLQQQQQQQLIEAMVELHWEEAVALVRQTPELVLREELLAHAESAPLLESVLSSAPGTYQQLASTARVAQVLSEAGSVLAAVELGRRPLREEDVQSLARIAGEKDLQVRSACR
jgi:hypothetical protein